MDLIHDGWQIKGQGNFKHFSTTKTQATEYNQLHEASSISFCLDSLTLTVRISGQQVITSILIYLLDTDMSDNLHMYIVLFKLTLCF